MASKSKKNVNQNIVIQTKKVDAETSEKKKRKRELLFKIITISLPIIVILLLELSLRIVGYGHNYNLIIENKDYHDFYQMNPYAADRYFTDSLNSTVGNIELFQKEKKAGTFRIFVLGESTTIGFPYPPNVSFPRWLQYRLMHSYPQENFEVINFSLTAVNSYTIWGFANEIVKFHPDLILIYTGQNEYYGALGVCSTSNLGNNPWFVRFVIKLRDLRLSQLVLNISNSVKRKFGNYKVDNTKGLMARMPSKNNKIPLNSEVYKAGIYQFESNMNLVCKTFKEYKIPVVLSNIVSNEKDLKPFISDEKDSTNSANHFYWKAKSELKNGNYKLAKSLFIKAKEYDLLRFRAPAEINKIIEKLCKKYSNIYLANAVNLFENNSKHGILGNETLLEHVHPNMFGYALLSDAFWTSLKNNNLIPFKSNFEMTFNELLAQMPITIVDSLQGPITGKKMRSQYPFNDTIDAKECIFANDPESQIASKLYYKELNWIEAMKQLLNYYHSTNNWNAGSKVIEALVLDQPYAAKNYLIASNHCTRKGNIRKSANYLTMGFRFDPNVNTAQKLLGQLLTLEDTKQAITVIDYLINNYSGDINFVEIRKIVTELDYNLNLIAKFKSIDRLNTIALCYIKVGQFPLAQKYLEIALEMDRNNPTSYKLLKYISQRMKK